MSIKVHFLYHPQDKFSDNCGDMSDEQGEWFHQIIKTMKKSLPGMVGQMNDGWQFLKYQKGLK